MKKNECSNSLSLSPRHTVLLGLKCLVAGSLNLQNIWGIFSLYSSVFNLEEKLVKPNAKSYWNFDWIAFNGVRTVV